MQVLDPESLEAMRRTFEEEAKAPNFPGLLVDFDHFSHDPTQPTTAAGWIGELDQRDDGLYAKIRWSDLGAQALHGGRYRLASPVWNRAECDEWKAPSGPEGKETVHLRPRRLDRLALTNDPNLPGLAPLSNRSGATLREAPAVRLPIAKATLRRGDFAELEVAGDGGGWGNHDGAGAAGFGVGGFAESLRSTGGRAGGERPGAVRGGDF